MSMRLHPQEFPDVILLLGTDAAGKDYVANILSEMIHEAGGDVQKRRGFFSSKSSRTKDSTRKSLLSHAQEILFLALYPWVGALLPLMLTGLIRLDMRRYVKTDKKLIVVGHHGLRALAFHLGYSSKSRNSFAVPEHLKKAFQLMQRKTQAHIIVLDVHNDVRRRRLLSRAEKGKHDYFDRYMLAHSARSERIEACLVRVASELFGGTLLENNDLGETDLRRRLFLSFAAPKDRAVSIDD